MIRALFAILLLFGAAACGERETAPPSAPAKPALWVIENAEGEPEGWLFGTIHALPDDARWETPALAEAIEDAGVLVVEVRDLDPKRTAATLQRLARDSPGPPLAERLPAPARRDLAELFARKGKSSNAYDELETWAAALALARLGGTAPAANGVDKALIVRFAGRPIAELEGAAGQLAIFDGLPERDQRTMLAAVLAEQESPAADARTLAKLWLAGDLPQIERTARQGLLADPALYEALAAGRNAAWLPKILPMLERGRKPLIAVGTVHMLGPDGLRALLAAKGYRISRIQ